MTSTCISSSRRQMVSFFDLLLLAPTSAETTHIHTCASETGKEKKVRYERFPRLSFFKVHVCQGRTGSTCRIADLMPSWPEGQSGRLHFPVSDCFCRVTKRVQSWRTLTTDTTPILGQSYVHSCRTLLSENGLEPRHHPLIKHG